jgi:hypothetical protein
MHSLDIVVSEGFKKTLSQLALETSDTQPDILVKSLALLVIALRAKRQGKRLVISGNTSTEEVTGL